VDRGKLLDVPYDADNTGFTGNGKHPTSLFLGHQKISVFLQYRDFKAYAFFKKALAPIYMIFPPHHISQNCVCVNYRRISHRKSSNNLAKECHGMTIAGTWSQAKNFKKSESSPGNQTHDLSPRTRHERY
jgi:hypothetical protein